VSAYFKNIGQTKTLIELIQERSEIQARSSVEMKEKFAHYNLELEEVLIGTPRSPEGDNRIEQILTQLRDRQVAFEKLETFEKQRIAADKERELKEAMAVAEQQTMLTQSEINIHVQENAGRAELQRAQQDAERVKTLAAADAQRVKLLADGEATRIKLTAEADAEREARVGIGKAIAIEEQVRAYGGPQLQLIQDVMTKLSTAIEAAKIPIVPSTYVEMGGGKGAEGEGGGGANAFNLLMTLLATEKLQSTGPLADGDPEQAEAVRAIKTSIRDQMVNAGAPKPPSTKASPAPAPASSPAPKVALDAVPPASGDTTI